jgi:hypothetical protein
MSFFDHQGVRRWLPLAQEPTVGPLPGGRLVRAGLPPYRDLPANPLLGGGTATWFKEATDEHHPPKYMEHGDSVVIIQADDDVHDVPPDDDTPVPAGPEAKRGRPSPKDLVQAEARRRIDEELDKIPDTLKAWGNEIWEWLGDNHPGVKRGKPGAIERHLSDLFNKAQGRKAQT